MVSDEEVRLYGRTPLEGTESCWSLMDVLEMCFRDSGVRASYGVASLGPVGTLTEGPQQQVWTVTVSEGPSQRQEAETSS